MDNETFDSVGSTTESDHTDNYSNNTEQRKNVPFRRMGMSMFDNETRHDKFMKLIHFTPHLYTLFVFIVSLSRVTHEQRDFMTDFAFLLFIVLGVMLLSCFCTVMILHRKYPVFRRWWFGTIEIVYHDEEVEPFL